MNLQHSRMVRLLGNPLMIKRGFSQANHLLELAYKGWEGTTPEKSYTIPKVDIEGEIPADLKGTFLRNGPGLIEKFGQKLVHPIDGDGIVCALTFPGDGTAHFKSRFVETAERKAEEEAQQFLFRGQMGTITDEQKQRDTKAVAEAIRTGVFPRIPFHNPSNTNVWHWGDRLISAYETSPPYALDPFDLKTIGKEDFDKTLSFKRLAAHFRIDTSDPANPRLVTGSYVRSPLPPDASLQINEYNWDMSLHKTHTYQVPGLTYFHDMALIDGYYVIHNSPFVTLNPQEGAKYLSGVYGPEDIMKLNKDLPCQLIFLPREGSGEQIVVESPIAFHTFHFGTCYREGSKVVLTTTALQERFDMSWEWRYWLSNMCKAPGRFSRIDIDLESRSAEMYEIDPCSNEFPCSHPFRHGHVGTRYNYLMGCDEPGRGLPFMDVVKVDAERGSEARKKWRADGLVGEVVFAPRAGYSSSTELAEDDGWLITQFYDPVTRPDQTQFLVLDARDVESGPVARIKLNFKVNYSFHGTFTPDVFLS